VATLVDGLVFPECPRWRVDTLWLSDMLDHRVIRVDESGHATLVADFETRPGGLGWLPDGRLLVVSMEERRVLAVDGRAVEEFSDLSDLAVHECNDMVVDGGGRAYVGHVGRSHTSAEVASGDLILVRAGTGPRVVASGLQYPNGCAITPDGRRLILAEFDGDRLVSFGIEEDGTLSEPRIFAELESHPDGICLDAEGAVWVASPRAEEALRVREGGSITARVTPGHPVYAVALGGTDGRTLFLCGAPASNVGLDELVERRGGRVEAVRVDVPGVGAP
jgi:sugar lactone lactonase YvrE